MIDPTSRHVVCDAAAAKLAAHRNMNQSRIKGHGSFLGGFGPVVPFGAGAGFGAGLVGLLVAFAI